MRVALFLESLFFLSFLALLRKRREAGRERKKREKRTGEESVHLDFFFLLLYTASEFLLELPQKRQREEGVGSEQTRAEERRTRRLSETIDRERKSI